MIARRLLSTSVLCVLAGASAASLPNSAAGGTALGLKVYKEVRHDISPPLSELIRAYDAQHLRAILRPHIERVPRIYPKGPVTIADGINGSGLAPGSVPTTDILNFDGIAAADSDCDCTPPDTDGAVGATQYVQWVNVAFAIYDKATGALIVGPTPGNALWQGFPGRCADNNDGDIIAQYDKAAGRWVMMQPVFSDPYRICIAVSQTADATGVYNRYEFNKRKRDPDYPKLGIWPAPGNEGYFLTDNDGFVGAELCAMDRHAMIKGRAATMQCIKRKPDVESVLPADFDGTMLPPTGADEIFADIANNTTIEFWHMHADFSNPGNTTVTGPISVTVPQFQELCGVTCVPQKDTSQKLDALGDRLMYRLAYRNFGDHEAIVANHSVGVNGRGAVRWYEFRGASNPTLVQSGNITSKVLWNWMGSIGMDKKGDIAVGFSTSSSTDYPGIDYFGRTPGLRAGKMQKHAGGNTTDGGGSQTGSDRWGDYSAMSIDPVDDCTFYYTNEYLPQSGTNNWNTKVNAFKFNHCR